MGIEDGGLEGDSLELRIKPDDNFNINFENGYLKIIGERAFKEHGEPCRLVYQRPDLFSTGFVNLIDFMKLEKSINPHRYIQISEYTKAKKILFGGLKLKEERKEWRLITTEVNFSRKEYNIIMNYLRALGKLKPYDITETDIYKRADETGKRILSSKILS